MNKLVECFEFTRILSIEWKLTAYLYSIHVKNQVFLFYLKKFQPLRVRPLQFHVKKFSSALQKNDITISNADRQDKSWHRSKYPGHTFHTKIAPRTPPGRNCTKIRAGPSKGGPPRLGPRPKTASARPVEPAAERPLSIFM